MRLGFGGSGAELGRQQLWRNFARYAPQKHHITARVVPVREQRFLDGGVAGGPRRQGVCHENGCADGAGSK